MLQDVEGHKGNVVSLGWNCTGELLATGATDRTTRVWHIKGSHSAHPSFTSHTFNHASSVNCLMWHPSDPGTYSVISVTLF